MKKFLLLGAVLVSGFLVLPAQPSAIAAIAVDSNFQGTLVITTPEGEINLVEPGDAIPEIKSGSILEVFDGQFRVTTGADDSVEVSCLENDASVKGGSVITLSCGESNGSLKVESGSAVVVDPAGKQIELAAGATHEIKVAVTEEADATAAGEELGTALEDGAGDVDSTNIEVTDNQEQQSTVSQ